MCHIYLPVQVVVLETLSIMDSTSHYGNKIFDLLLIIQLWVNCVRDKLALFDWETLSKKADEILNLIANVAVYKVVFIIIYLSCLVSSECIYCLFGDFNQTYTFNVSYKFGFTVNEVYSGDQAVSQHSYQSSFTSTLCYSHIEHFRTIQCQRSETWVRQKKCS